MYRDAVRNALDAVADLDRDDPLRGIAFQEILRASLAAGPTVQGGDTSSQSARPPSHAPLERLGSRLGLEMAVVQRVFDFEGGTPTLTIQAARLRATKAGATQQIALLLCAARQEGLGEGETAADVIRQACDEFGRLDEPNFASALRPLGGMLIAGGSARARTYRLTRPGYEKVKSLVETLGS